MVFLLIKIKQFFMKNELKTQGQKVILGDLLTATSSIENAPYHVLMEEKNVSGKRLEKYINTAVGNHASCSTQSCKNAH